MEFALGSRGEIGIRQIGLGDISVQAQQIAGRQLAIQHSFDPLDILTLFRRESLDTTKIQQTQTAVIHEDVVSGMGIRVAHKSVVQAIPGRLDLPAELIASLLRRILRNKLLEHLSWQELAGENPARGVIVVHARDDDAIRRLEQGSRITHAPRLLLVVDFQFEHPLHFPGMSFHDRPLTAEAHWKHDGHQISDVGSNRPGDTGILDLHGNAFTGSQRRFVNLADGRRRKRFLVEFRK